MSHSLCVMGVYDEVKMTVPMIVRYVHSYSKKKHNNGLLDVHVVKSSFVLNYGKVMVQVIKIG
jgi:hypothetical protein